MYESKHKHTILYMSNKHVNNNIFMSSYHILLYVIILCHLNKCLKQSSMMLYENLTCFTVTTLTM